MAKIKYSDNTKCWQEYGEMGSSIYILLWECKVAQMLWKIAGQFLIKLSTQLGIYPREMKAYVHTEVYTQMFIEVYS